MTQPRGWLGHRKSLWRSASRPFGKTKNHEDWRLRFWQWILDVYNEITRKNWCLENIFLGFGKRNCMPRILKVAWTWGSVSLLFKAGHKFKITEIQIDFRLREEQKGHTKKDVGVEYYSNHRINKWNRDELK